MHFDIITLFPEMFKALEASIVGRALSNNLITIEYWNPRDFTTDPRKTVDDKPYGGGPGMVMQFEPLAKTIAAIKEKRPHSPVIYLSPQGKRLDQGTISEISTGSDIILLSGRYEGIDERLLITTIDAQWSIGDYVLTGGELAAMVVIDAITRLLPGALGDAASAEAESFTTGLLDYPHYTRPENVAGFAVPKVLLSGDHQEIARWRRQQALGRTYLQRPDLLKNRVLSAEEETLLNEFIKQSGVDDEQSNSSN